MLSLNFVLLYVEDPAASGDFYAGLLARAPVHAEETFVMFVFDNGLRLGLWARSAAAPGLPTPAGASEVAFEVKADADVDALCTQWWERGVKVIEPPSEKDFGRTFLAADPDGHRLRVFAPSAPRP